MDLYERIAELGSMGYHCSQMMMIMTLETIGEENPQLVKALGGLGGGIGYCGDICGCLTGGACAIGYFLGNLAPEEKEDVGVFYCKDITHLDWGVIMERCPALIAETYMKVMEILTERGIIEV